MNRSLRSNPAGGIFGILRAAVANLPALTVRPVRQVLYRQIYFIGIESLGRTVAMGVLIGGTLIIHIVNLIGMSGSATTGKVIVWLTVRELGPLFTAMIAIARSSTAIAAELGAMSMTGEIESLKAMGIDPDRYLIMPRVLGVVSASAALAFYFEFSALFGGNLLATLILDVPFEEFLSGVLAALTFPDFMVSLVKSVCFSVAIGATACLHGLRVGNSLTRIPQAIVRATSQGLFLVLLLDSVADFAIP